MATDKGASGSPAIVGGRPMRRAVEVSDLPQGVEGLLTLAALNHGFRTELLRAPVVAASGKGIVLDDGSQAGGGDAQAKDSGSDAGGTNWAPSKVEEYYNAIGDCLHPNKDAHQKMGEACDLSLFEAR